MGPGVMGQLVEMWRSDPDTARLCLTCHAPLAEQAPGSANYEARLAADGIVCAACHVRNHQRFGPPRRDGSTANSTAGPLPHDGAVRTPAFRASEFCAACHQFEPDGFALNDKLLTLDLSREIRDTRIPSGGTVAFAYRRPLEPAVAALAATATVERDYSYTRFFESLLASGSGAGESQIRAALDASRRSSFEVFSRRLPLT